MSRFASGPLAEKGIKRRELTVERSEVTVNGQFVSGQPHSILFPVAGSMQPKRENLSTAAATAGLLFKLIASGKMNAATLGTTANGLCFTLKSLGSKKINCRVPFSSTPGAYTWRHARARAIFLELFTHPFIQPFPQCFALNKNQSFTILLIFSTSSADNRRPNHRRFISLNITPYLGVSFHM